MQTKIVYEFPFLSQDFDEEPKISHIKNNYVLDFLFWRDGKKFKSGIIFKRYRYVSFTAESCLDLYQISSGMDIVAELIDSELLKKSTKNSLTRI